jgi:uncharacterized membrane protein
VMIVMALDHTRDFIHDVAGRYSPTDLNNASVTLFLTRWITHFCLPVFMFTAGIGSQLWLQRNGDRSRLSRFLLARGLWLILLELTVMRLAYNFSFSMKYPFFLLVLWIFGLCMVLMAALVHIPVRLLLTISLVIIALSNGLDGLNAATFGREAWIWKLVRQPGLFMAGQHPVIVTYPLIPWLAVISAGFCFGRVYRRPEAVRKRSVLIAGLTSCTLFLILRTINRYGDPTPWHSMGQPLRTVLSFLNCTKYPGSLDFLLMTLGPALLLLSFLMTTRLGARNPLMVFGRVPLFYFIAHFYLAHSAIVLLEWARRGSRAWSFAFSPVPSMGGATNRFPVDFGFRLWAVYAVWIAVVFLLYPVCRWYGDLKMKYPSSVLRYL